MKNRIVIQLLNILILSVISFKCTTDKPTDKKNIKNRSDYPYKVGETFTIKLTEARGHLGYSYCWVNEGSCTVIKNLGIEYVEGKGKYIEEGRGGGGSIIWTFKAVKPGIDTLKIHECPTARIGQDCQYFSLDSIDIANREGDLIPPKPALEYLIMVKK